jgi:hypothetical protein
VPLVGGSQSPSALLLFLNVFTVISLFRVRGSYPVFSDTPNKNRARKPYNSGRSTAQLGEQRNTKRLRSADHTTRKHIGGLNWDINMHRSTQQLSTTQLSSVGLGHQHDQLKQLQRIGLLRLGHRTGCPQLCSVVDASHQTQLHKNQHLSSPPLNKDTTNIFSTRRKTKSKKKKERALTEATNDKAPSRRTRWRRRPNRGPATR